MADTTSPRATFPHGGAFPGIMHVPCVVLVVEDVIVVVVVVDVVVDVVVVVVVLVEVVVVVVVVVAGFMTQTVEPPESDAVPA